MSEQTDATRGRFVLVVGPSGAGKDTLLRAAAAALAADPRFVFPRRWVTRASDAYEDCKEVSADEFADSRSRGLFALSWEAHGHGYGIAREIEPLLARGHTVVCNVSRSVVAEARSRFAGIIVIEISARPEILTERLRNRRREDPAAQVRRLERAARDPDAYEADFTIDNSADIEPAVARFLNALTAIANPGANPGV